MLTTAVPPHTLLPQITTRMDAAVLSWAVHVVIAGLGVREERGKGCLRGDVGTILGTPGITDAHDATLACKQGPSRVARLVPSCWPLEGTQSRPNPGVHRW